MAALGSGVREQWVLGHQVMALLCGGGYAEYVSVPEELVMPVPPNLTITQAAAIPEAWLTAFQLLHIIGNQHSSPHEHTILKYKSTMRTT